MRKYIPILYSISSFESTHINLWDEVIFSYCFTSVFTSANIIFQKFLELHSNLSEKKIFVTNFPFLMHLVNPATP